jgi:hypothetical protein
VSFSAFEIKVYFELQNSTTILEFETTYTNIQGFFLQVNFLGVVVHGGCMCLWSCKIYSFANFVFVIWSVGVWDE